MSSEEPSSVRVAKVLHAAVEAAVMAPSTHNSQPWRFRIAGGVLEIFADPGRHLHVIDGERRQQVQSCGCALYNARVAVRAMGFDEEVTVMLTDSVHPQLLATLALGGARITSNEDCELMGAISKRRTNRRPFLKRAVAAADTDRLIRLAAEEGATMVRLDPSQKHRLGELIDQADRLQYGDPAFRAEMAQWLVAFGSSRRDGIPFVEKEFGSALPFTVMRALRSPHLGDELGRLEEDLVAASPVVW